MVPLTKVVEISAAFSRSICVPSFKILFVSLTKYLYPPFVVPTSFGPVRGSPVINAFCESLSLNVSPEEMYFGRLESFSIFISSVVPSDFFVTL
ncbi:hypothetical protein [uncultured Dubosiella sp.]|uniref:hypothetical protein n=1 Tax=uncultured Dubosiella sp. TaxID=1937011 RepID=UPI002670B75A|nr:hypothetical protein [uncultured Dubosiella sp.]